MKPVVSWLLVGCVMIVCMVVIGGITRLTGSGLSMTKWEPIMGAVPPMNEAEWNEAFDCYKKIPEYQLFNQHMDLAGFKQIFFWEYLHRNWGRLMGLVFIIPFVVFWRRGLLKGWLMRRCWWILAGGGAVAALGWFMVYSGLEDNPDVSHFRLAIHLCAAFSVLGLVLWTVFDIQQGRRSFGGDGSPAARAVRWLLVLVGVQIVYGAFTAGLDAGRVYNTWPLMHGSFVPENLHATGSWLKDLTDHKEGVQFIHRNLAWLVALGVFVFAWRFKSEKHLYAATALVVSAVVLQFILGVLTLLGQVPITLGVLHQLGAVLLLSSLLFVVYRSGRAI